MDLQRKDPPASASDAALEAERLRRSIEYHSRRYYVEDSPEISDFEYDAMYRRLVDIEAAYPELATPDSPTRRVGGAALDKFEKFTHPRQMGSLSDVFSIEELREFLDKLAVEIVVAGIEGKRIMREVLDLPLAHKI